MIAVGGAYGYGHHVGWGDRDAEMQVEIAKKNDEAREKERELAQQLNDQSTKLSEANNVITQKQSDVLDWVKGQGTTVPKRIDIWASQPPVGLDPSQDHSPLVRLDFLQLNLYASLSS